MSDAPARAERPRAKPRTFACPNCGGSIEVRAAGISVSAICASCGATVDVASPELKIIEEAQKRTREPPIGIGRRGTLFGTAWQVVGYQTRSSADDGSWDEYLLFNPYRGFRFLAHDSEGWSVFCMLRHDVQPPGPPESESEARTDYVLGEFYWRARAGDVAKVASYKAGARMLLCERTGDEVVWSQGVALPEKVVRDAFQLAPSPAAQAVHRRPTLGVLTTGIIAFVLLCLLDLIPFGRDHGLVVFQQSFSTSVADRGRTITTAVFDVPDSSGNLQIEVFSPVRNDWTELGLSLARVPGALSYDARTSIEYYYGTDSDGSWEEGGQTNRVMFTRVPGGTYRLLIDPDAGAYAKGLGQDFSVTIRRNVSASEFFWIALLLLVPYPLYRLFFRRGSA